MNALTPEISPLTKTSGTKQVRCISPTAEMPLPSPNWELTIIIWSASNSGGHCTSLGGFDGADVVTHSCEQFDKQDGNHRVVFHYQYPKRSHRTISLHQHPCFIRNR